MIDKKYQVFISSTHSDLEKEREGIIKGILELYHIPIGMEMFSAEDEDQWEIIRRTIDVSDYYILVLGLRYGTKTKSNISYTQKEYEYAIEKNIPVLAFVMNENVSLSKEKRDDDLTEINAFRSMVLKNSKMAQFWSTKDELVKNVSISLMKQIMQKPGVGWIRGDNAISAENLSQELMALSKENRELREKVIELESKISIKSPKIGISIGNLTVDGNFNKYNKISVPEIININNIDENLRQFITEEEINKFNENIPSEKDVHDYNVFSEKYYKIINYSSELIVEIFNNGTSKASSLYIDIQFPEEILIMDVDEKIEEPKSPIPYNPINRAKAKYEESIKKAAPNRGLFGALNHSSLLGVAYNSPSLLNLPRILPANANYSTSINDNNLTIRINNLIHTRTRTFDDEYKIIPLKTGVHSIKVSVICEEMETPDEFFYELNVQE